MRYAWIVLTIVILTACSPSTDKEEPFVVHAFKVGKADSFLVSYNGEHLLIDAGEEDDGQKIVTYLQEQGIEQLSALIVTHFDKDHVGGADHIVEALPIDTIYVPNYYSGSKQTRQFLEAVAARQYELVHVTTDTAISFENVRGMIYPPKTLYAGDNNNSLVVDFTYRETSFLFTGDIEAERIEALLAQNKGNYMFLKVPHHGRFNEKTVELIEQVQPEIALITSSNKNPEADETTAVLEQVGAEIYTTRAGDVTFSSNGMEIYANK